MFTQFNSTDFYDRLKIRGASNNGNVNLKTVAKIRPICHVIRRCISQKEMFSSTMTTLTLTPLDPPVCTPSNRQKRHSIYRHSSTNVSTSNRILKWSSTHQMPIRYIADDLIRINFFANGTQRRITFITNLFGVSFCFGAICSKRN